MSQIDADDIRNAAELIISSTQQNSMSLHRGTGGTAGFSGQPYYPNFDISRGHSINLITEEFLGGYMQDGRMSVVRRFFCLFVTFDLFFVSLLWLICIMINGDNIFQAFQKQIVHYTISTSLFDVVGTAIIRFVVLIIFYALLYIEHWFIIAFSTSGSCLFLISKVFVFDWVDSRQQVFEVILIITSFVIAWGEAWFLDCRVLPQERHARRYFSTLTSDRSPLIAPFLAVQDERTQRDSASNFYSPLDSAHDSDAEEEEDEEYHKMALECVRRAYELLEKSDWKVEKVTSKGDTIRSTQREKIGKVYRLTARIKYPAKELLEELFYRVEFIPKWNPTLLESKIVRKINSYTDITYQATVGSGGGIVKSRDFVNLRCWRLYRNGKMCTTEEELEPSGSDEDSLNRSCEGSVSTISDVESCTPLPGSVGSVQANFSSSSKGGFSIAGIGDTSNAISNTYQTLSQSLGAKGFRSAMPHIDFNEPPPLDEDQFEDAKEHLDDDGAAAAMKSASASTSAPIIVPILKTTKDKVWMNAAISVDYAKVPVTKYTRGENIVAAFALREIEGKSDSCIFEWILCLDLKGYIPRYVLDNTYTTFMTDYMTHLRKYVNELRQTRRRVPKS